MHFAARTSFGSGSSAYGVALHAARQTGKLLDLTQSNPTRCGLTLPVEAVSALADPAAVLYTPDPLGLLSARKAVSQMYKEEHNATVHPDRLVLTASTSESYSFLLRLLCDPGDEILVPSPSYPLFDLLAKLHDVTLVEYPLVYHDGWQIDPASLRTAVTARTRAIVTIHPNNPTGHYCSEDDRKLLLQVAAEQGLPLIVDEVFLEYDVEQRGAPSFLANADRAPTETVESSDVLLFVLGGLSKLLCLPQMKLGWMAVQGPSSLVAEAMARLEVIADTFLSVGTPPQLALPAWLATRHDVHRRVGDRIIDNLAELDRTIAGSVVSRLRVEGGWSVVLRVPAVEDDEQLAVRLLRDWNLAVHPGSLYGFPGRGWLVVSLLPVENEFRSGIAALLQAF